MWYNDGMRIIECFRRNWLITNIIIVLGEIIIACLIWLSGDWFLAGSRETFGPLNSYIFIWLSIVIATVAAFNTVRASLIASKSLELSRATTRPFLNVVGGISVIWSRNDGSPTPVNYFVIHVGNTGIFPADHVSVVLNVSKTNSDNQKHLFVVEGEIPSICFPGEGINNLIFRETKEKEQLTLANQDKLKVIIEISYQNKLTHQFHKTIRSYLAQYVPTAQRAPTPLRRDDFWD